MTTKQVILVRDFIKLHNLGYNELMLIVCALGRKYQSDNGFDKKQILIPRLAAYDLHLQNMMEELDNLIENNPFL